MSAPASSSARSATRTATTSTGSGSTSTGPGSTGLGGSVDAPVDPDLERGQRVGEYEVDGKLGQGAFGSVFRAIHPVIGKLVAIKVLARKFSVDPEMVSRFIAEARAVNQIRHRHIIDIFAFGQLEDGRHYYVMEYVDGEPLDAAIDREGRLPLSAAIPILRAIGRALDAAHAKGIAHRDLKAENVFLGRDPDGAVFPKLLDFGIAKLLAPEDGQKHRTRTGVPVGTPYYMSPEQCRGRDVDHRTDLYAFGVLAYRLITGKYPLDADDYMSILVRQMSDDADPASLVVPEIPAGVDEAIAWLMAKDPAQRPPNLRAAVEAMETAAVAAGFSISPAVAIWDVQSGAHGKLPTQPARAASDPGAALAATIDPDRARPVRSPRRGGLAVAALALAAGVAAMAITVQLRAEQAEQAEQGRAPAASPAPAPAASPPTAPAIAAPAKTAATAEKAAGSAELAAHVLVDVTGVPEGTEVLVGGALVGVAPGPVQLPQADEPVVLTFAAAGYAPASRTITPDRPQALAVSLKRRAAPAPRKRSSHQAPAASGADDIIDVFSQGAP